MSNINAQIREILSWHDQVSLSKGVWTVRTGFFYTHGVTSEKFEASIVKELEEFGILIRVLESGEVWKPFKGGASVASQSHWYVKFRVV